MSRSADIINRSLKQCQSVIGEMILAVIKQDNLRRSQILYWQRQLHKAADTLDDLIK